MRITSALSSWLIATEYVLGGLTAIPTTVSHEVLKTYIYAVYLVASEVAVPSIPYWHYSLSSMTAFALVRRSVVALRYP